MIIPRKLERGDTIGVVAPSDPIIGKNIEEIMRAREILEKDGFKVKFSKNLFSNTCGYSATAKEKAEDINGMFQDKDVKMVWCAKGGNNSNSVFEYLDYNVIKNNPKIVCGYSDITSLTNMIFSKTGLVTFSGTNFKTIATDETDYSYKEIIKRFVEGSLEIGKEKSGYKTIKDGSSEGELIGGNLSLTKGLVDGKYKIDFTDKILFLEDLGYESEPAFISNYLYYMRQNKVFDKIKEHANKAKDSAVQVTKTVIEKTNNIVNQTKLKFSISETKSKIKDIYTEIGKSVYENYKSTGEVIDDMEEKFAKIDAMTEEVNELKEQLYQLKENVKCPKCGAYNHSDDVYCSKCGERIYNVNSDDTDSYDDDEVVIINAKKPETEED